MRLLLKRAITSLAATLLAAAVLVPAAWSHTGQPSSSDIAAVKRSLAANYPQLLMEKGVFDSTGQEIASRVADLVAACYKDGVRGPSELTAAVHRRLNY